EEPGVRRHNPIRGSRQWLDRGAERVEISLRQPVFAPARRAAERHRFCLPLEIPLRLPWVRWRRRASARPIVHRAPLRHPRLRAADQRLLAPAPAPAAAQAAAAVIAEAL